MRSPRACVLLIVFGLKDHFHGVPSYFPAIRASAKRLIPAFTCNTLTSAGNPTPYTKESPQTALHAVILILRVCSYNLGRQVAEHRLEILPPIDYAVRASAFFSMLRMLEDADTMTGSISTASSRRFAKDHGADMESVLMRYYNMVHRQDSQKAIPLFSLEGKS